MQRVLRAGLLAFAAVFVGLTAQAAQGSNAPVVSGVSSWITSPGQQIIVSGDHFSNDLFTNNCNSGVPTVNFELLGAPGIYSAQPASTNSSDCTNTAVKVTVPPQVTAAAQIRVVDFQGKASADNFMITNQPSANLTPNSGQVGTSVTLSGANIPPPTLAAAPFNQMHFTFSPGIDSMIAPASQVVFNPGNTNGTAQLSFQVAIDLNNPNSRAAVTVPAGNYTFLPPSASTAAFNGKVVGDQLTISGQHLGSAGTVTFAGGASGQGINWGSSQIGVTVPSGAQDGPIALSVSTGGYGSIPGPSIKLNPLVKGMTPGVGSAGTAVKITGFNFGGTAGKVTAAGIGQSVASWTDQAISFNLSGDTDSGAVSITRADGLTAAASNISIVPRLDKIETNNVKAGSPIVIDGASLGAATGTAKVGSVDSKPELWSRASVLLTVPASLAPGSYPVVLTSAAGTVSNALSLTVVPGPSTTPAPSNQAGGHAPSSFIDNNHQFHKPPKTASPVQLSLTAATHSLKAGGTSDLTVVLTLNGKPVPGAEIKLRMLFTPGDDYKFTPETGTTDATGTFTAKVTISKTNGDTIIQAESGIFSDQDHIVGTGGAAPLSTVNPAATGGIVPLVGLGVLALLLVGFGVWLNLRSGRTIAVA